MALPQRQNGKSPATVIAVLHRICFLNGSYITFFIQIQIPGLTIFTKKNKLMKCAFLLALLLVGLQSISQNVGINNPAPDASAQLDIASTTKGLLLPRMTAAQRGAIPSPANGLLVYQTDVLQGLYYNTGTPATPIWTYVQPPSSSWNTGGNSLLATGSFGTTSNNHVDLITNGVTRGRLSNLGEFFIGATNTVIPGDLMSAISNATFPFATNGYSSFNGSGVYGAVTGGNTQFAAVQGEYQATTAGTFNTAGVRGSNQSGTAGTGFRTQSLTGPRAGVIGNTTVTSGQYTFGVHGSMNSTDIRCGAFLGDDFGIALAAMGYYSAGQVDYSVYGFGRGYEIGGAGGRSSAPADANTQIGIGIYGGVMGGWVRGLVYGAHVKGDRYSLYVDGRAYTNEPVTELVPMANGSRTPAYSLTTLQPEIIARGKASLVNGRMQIGFDAAFAEMVSSNPDDLVITVSPLGPSKGLYIAGQDAKGFIVAENENGGGTVSFSWIAIATRKGMEKITHAPELLDAGFDRKMNGVMFNDNNTVDKPQSIWWDGQQVRFDAPPPRKADTDYRTGVRVVKDL
jgi:hypothetical protein